MERHLFLDYPLRLHYLLIRGFTEHKVVRTGFEPVRQAQQLGIVFINVGSLPITVFYLPRHSTDYIPVFSSHLAQHTSETVVGF